MSKKAELLSKDKLSQCKKNLERTEKDFLKFREDSEQREESLKTEISILQKHYENLQTQK